MVVMKFGGTSVGSVDSIRTAARVVAARRAAGPAAGPIVVLSAMGGVTDRLASTGDLAVRGDIGAVTEGLAGIREVHERAIADLLPDDAGRRALEAELDPVWEEMQKVFTGVLLLRERSPRSRDLIWSFGERLSVPIFAAFLNHEGVSAVGVDARKLIVTGEGRGTGLVDFEETRRRAGMLTGVVRNGDVPVVTGFLCSTPEGVTTTLGRGGSDYTASVLGHVLHAEEIEIWTDVDGVMTADPRIVPGARVLAEISYKEAAEMSYFGAKVLHPKTILPAADLGIPIRIRNTFAPEGAGTLITRESPPSHQGVKTVTSIRDLSLVSIEGSGMIGVPGTAQRAFGSIAAHAINVLMFSQGSSEQHISLVVNRADSRETVRALRAEFEPEIEKRQIDRINEIREIAVVALVGEGMRSIPGVAARTFGVIGENRVNVLMIAQGSSELNLSLVVEENAVARAVRSIHDAFELGTE